MVVSTNVCVFGLGEAGSLLATDLISAGCSVAAYDPVEVPTPDGVERFVHPSLAVRRADVVLGLTGGADAELAILQSLDAIAGDALYADLSTASPTTKRELARHAEGRGLAFADVALLAMVPSAGLSTPSLVSGTGADRYVETLGGLGAEVDTVAGPAGTAAAKKLLRSVVMKGTAAVIIEAVRAGAAADDLDWLWSNLVSEFDGADESWMRRLVEGTQIHATRRTHEMEAAVAMLDELGAPSVMTAATVNSLRELSDGTVPALPARPSAQD